MFRNLGLSFLDATGFAATLLESAAAAGLFALLFFGELKPRNRAILLTAAAFAAALAGYWVAAAGMVGRHPAILIPSVMFSLYFLPERRCRCCSLRPRRRRSANSAGRSIRPALRWPSPWRSIWGAV